MNLRIIKKDIEFLVNDFIDDCMIYIDFHDGKNSDKVIELVDEAIDMGNNLFNRVNHIDKNEIKEQKKTKAYYKAISNDLLSGIDGLCEKLSALTK